MSEDRHEHWTPRKRDIGQAKIACACPDDVEISKLPKNASLATGTGIRDDALVLSPSHLKYIRFPLHPLFHAVLGALNLHPMQLSPNSYLQLSVFLAWALQVGATIDCDDFFNFHDCILIPKEVDYFHFASRSNCKFFDNKPSSHKNWKNRPLLITGNWAAPELNYPKIRSTFAASASNCTTSLSREQIQWLNTHSARSYLDIKEFSTPNILLQISQNRANTFQPEHLKPGVEVKALTTHIFELLANKDAAFSVCPERVAERGRLTERVEKRNRSGETDEAVHSFEDTDRVDLDQVEPTMVREFPDMIYSPPSKQSKRKTKRSGSSALGVKKRLKTVLDQSAHSSGTCLEPISTLVVGPRQTAQQASGLPTNFSSLFHPADSSAFQKTAPQKIMEHMKCHLKEFEQMTMAIETMLTETAQNNENKDKQLGELKQRVSELESQLHKVEAERDGLKADIIKVQRQLAKTGKEFKNEKDVRELEYENAEKRIKLESARHFRFGWVQALHPPNKRIFAGPDDFDTHLALEPHSYKLFPWMNPSDCYVEDDSENEDHEENENEPEDEDDQDEEDEDDQDGEDFNVPGRPPANNQDVSNSWGRRSVDNNLALSMQPQYMIQAETSQNRSCIPPQLNQETSNTTPQQKQTSPLCHSGQINHPVDNNQYVENSLGRRSVDNNLALSMQPQYMIQAETSQNRSCFPSQSNQETSNTTPQQKQTSPLCHSGQINHPVDNNQYVENSLGRRSVDNNLALSMQPQYMIQAETSQNRTCIPPQLNQETSNTTTQLTIPTGQFINYIPSQSNQETSNTIPQQKQTSPLCHSGQINHPVDNNQYVENSLGRRSVGNNLALSMQPQYMIQAEISTNKSHIPLQLNQGTSNTSSQLTSHSQYHQFLNSPDFS